MSITINGQNNTLSGLAVGGLPDGTVQPSDLTTGGPSWDASGNLSVTGIATVSGLNGGPLSGTRNKIINGAMEIDQRNSGAAVTLNNTNGYIVDRWGVGANGGAGTGTATVQQVTDAPAGLKSSLKYTVTNAKTPTGTDQFYIQQTLEGLNIIDFAFGTSSAKSITFSFWVKCSLTGTFSGSLRSFNSAVILKSYVFNYTINSANTWQYVTITAPGDTTSSPSLDNTASFAVLFDLGNGPTYQTSTLNTWQSGNYLSSTTSTKLISTLSATFQVTGVQLETGSVATPFERRSYGQELALCQRYYEAVTIGWIGATSGNALFGNWQGFTYKRIAPNATLISVNEQTNQGTVLLSPIYQSSLRIWNNRGSTVNAETFYNATYGLNAEL